MLRHRIAGEAGGRERLAAGIAMGVVGEAPAVEQARPEIAAAQRRERVRLGRGIGEEPRVVAKGVGNGWAGPKRGDGD